MIKNVVTFILFFLFASLSYADSFHLTQQQIERVRTSQNLLMDVDRRPLPKIIKDLEATFSPAENLQILEAIAATYDEIVRELKVTGQKKKDHLHDMIRLNMAYFQLAGKTNDHTQDPVNLLIRRKLKRHLSPELFSNPHLFFSME